MNFVVCPVGCSGSGLVMGAVLRLVDNPNVVMSFGLGVRTVGLVGLPNTSNGGGCFGFAAEVGAWVGLAIGVGVGFVLKKESGVVLIVGEGEVSKIGVVTGGGAGVEVEIGMVMETAMELGGCTVVGLSSGLDLGDGTGLAGEEIDLNVGLNVAPWADSILEKDDGVGWIIVAV